MKKQTIKTISILTATLLLSACGGGSNNSTDNLQERAISEQDQKIEQCFVEMDNIALEDCQSQYSSDEEINSCLDDYEEYIVNECMLDSENIPSDNLDNIEESNSSEIISDENWWDWLEGQGDENIDDNNSNIQNDSNTTATIAQVQNEPYFKYAWHLNSSNSILNSKGYQIDKNADINISGAWNITMGEGVKVAVIDDGADVNHEDLKENVSIAYNADTGGTNVLTKESHGNTCAGFIVAPINGKGTVGVSPKSKLIAIKLEDSSDAYTIRAFEYAKKQGAKVISCSWGTYNVSEAVVSELKSLYNSGVTVLFASGNEGTSYDVAGVNDESEVEWVIGVGASGENNDVTNYSNYGKNIDIIAPGGDSIGLLGLDDMGDSGSSEQKDLVNNNYAFTSGTSFATPITAGVVSMMYAVNPTITPKQVKEILEATATKVGKDNDANYDDKGFDTKRAYGKINAGRAVLEAKRLREI